MSNFDKAVEIIGELATEYGQPGGDELFGLDEDAALALKTAGLLAPDLPKPHEVEFPGFAIFNLPGAGCSIPLDGYAPQVMVIFGDEECSDATTDAGDRLTAIKPEDLDKLIACLLAAREYAEKEHGNE